MAHKIDSEWKTRQENLLIAIDQLEQITEVMGQVLSRVKQQVNALEEQKAASNEPNKAHPKKTKRSSSTKAKKIDLVH